MGANIKVKDGQTLLHIAVKRRQLEFIKWLLSLGVKVSARDNRGNTPLHIACDKANREGEDYEQVINLLLEQGAILFIENNDRKTPIDLADGKHYTILKSKEKDMLNKLRGLAQDYKSLLGLLDVINYSNNVCVQVHQGETLLHLAIQTNNIGIIKIVLQLGADIKMRNNSGDTALDLAVWGGNQEIINLLRENIGNVMPVPTNPNLVIDPSDLEVDFFDESSDKELPDLISDSDGE
ncbi:MAG: ankyrin repeat domain-containing protein, partial [Candidatus Amoebophilus sp.]